MDVLRKMFKWNDDEKNLRESEGKSFEDIETTDDDIFGDDSKFAFHIFTNPLELQKHFELQMQQILEAVAEMEERGGTIGKDTREPDFERNDFFKEFEKRKKSFTDTDLDGELYGEQLHTLIQRLNPGSNISDMLPSNRDKNGKRPMVKKEKLPDEDIIMGRIHGTLPDEDAAATQQPRPARPRPDMMTPMTPMIPRGAPSPFGGVFDGNYTGPKMFSQSVMTKTVRKPDGSYETVKITKDSQGNQTKTVTRTVDGKTETVVTYDGAAGVGAGPGGMTRQHDSFDAMTQQYSNRNIYVTKDGYVLPRNMW